jgi:Sugar phosphate permease
MSTMQASRSATAATLTVMPVLLAISFSHMMNDSMQAVVPALYTVLEQSLHLSYVQVGWITFVLNMTSSVLQPVVGSFTDRSSKPYLMTVGMTLSLLGMIGIALAPSFWFVLLSAMFIGFGSAIFHPEGSRVVYLAAGNRRGFAQSVYQVGGNTGSSLAPLMALRAVGLSGRRQHGQLARSADGASDLRSARPVGRSVGLLIRGGGDRGHALLYYAVVQTAAVGAGAEEVGEENGILVVNP